MGLVATVLARPGLECQWLCQREIELPSSISHQPCKGISGLSFTGDRAEISESFPI